MYFYPHLYLVSHTTLSYMYILQQMKITSLRVIFLVEHRFSRELKCVVYIHGRLENIRSACIMHFEHTKFKKRKNYYIKDSTRGC